MTGALNRRKTKKHNLLSLFLPLSVTANWAADNTVKLWDVRNFKSPIASAADLYNPYNLYLRPFSIVFTPLGRIAFSALMSSSC